MKEAPEGIVLRNTTSTKNPIDYNDIYGEDHPDQQTVRAFSRNLIETVDLISEGPIEGLVSGQWTYSGAQGETGWRRATFSGFKTPNTGSLSGCSYLRSIYYNETPILDENGLLNFQSVEVAYSLGNPVGTVIQNLSPYQKTSRSIGEVLRKNYPKTYRIINNDCLAVLINVKITALAITDPEEGNIGRTSVSWNIFYRPLFSNVQSTINADIVGGNAASAEQQKSEWILGASEKVWGKIYSKGPYVRSTRVDFNTEYMSQPNFIGWEVRIERKTKNSSSSLLSNATYVDSITEIQGNIYTYPNSSMVMSRFDAEYFSSVPERSFEVNLLKVKIPGNYNPILRTYSGEGFATTNGAWDGTFATGKYWTNNPAWCYYDLLTNKRYGLGKYIDSNYVDKWTLYQIGQYCDVLVSDGDGSLEPRFTANVYIGSREEAYKVINDMASIFRGMVYYSNGLIYAVQDAPKDPRVIFTNANVENGDFSYSSTSKRDRRSVAVVRYNDPRNYYKPAIEYVEDLDSIRKYGIRELDLTAFGCSSKGQAIRFGRCAVLSENMISESVRFVGGLEASILRPGDIFAVSDYNRKGKRYGGRALSIHNTGMHGSEVILDNKIDLDATTEYKLSVLTPSFTYDSSQVTGLNSNDYSYIQRNLIQKFYFSGNRLSNTGTTSILKLTQDFDVTNYNVSGYPVWSLEVSENSPYYTGKQYFSSPDYDYFQLLTSKEVDTNKYEIVGLQYNANKFIEIESGFGSSKKEITDYKVPATPTMLRLTLLPQTNANSAVTIHYSFFCDNLRDLTSFKVYVKKGDFPNEGIPDEQYLLTTLPKTTTEGLYYPQEDGVYYFRVYGYNEISNLYSLGYAGGNIEVGEIFPVRNIIISNLEMLEYTGQYLGNADNNQVSILYNADSDPKFTWQVGYEDGPINPNSTYYRVTVRDINSDNSRVPSPTIFSEVTGLTKTEWTFDIDDNMALANGPLRQYQIVVEAHDATGRTSTSNIIGSTEEETWTKFPKGYDILEIINPRQTGISPDDALATQESGNGEFVAYTGNYKAIEYIGPNSEVVIQFTSGNFDYDLAGGYLYTSTGQFPKKEALERISPFDNQVRRAKFEFSAKYPVITVPHAMSNFTLSNRGYYSVSFFDSLDDALIDRGQNIASGLYLSNNCLMTNTFSVNRLQLGCAGSLYTMLVTGAASSLSDPIITNNLPNGYSVVSYTATSEDPWWTTILYMSGPITDCLTGVPPDITHDDGQICDGYLSIEVVSASTFADLPALSANYAGCVCDPDAMGALEIWQGDNHNGYFLYGPVETTSSAMDLRCYCVVNGITRDITNHVAWETTVSSYENVAFNDINNCLNALQDCSTIFQINNGTTNHPSFTIHDAYQHPLQGDFEAHLVVKATYGGTTVQVTNYTVTCHSNGTTNRCV